MSWTNTLYTRCSCPRDQVINNRQPRLINSPLLIYIGHASGTNRLLSWSTITYTGNNLVVDTRLYVLHSAAALYYYYYYYYYIIISIFVLPSVPRFTSARTKIKNSRRGYMSGSHTKL